jgi:hypothetical protein
MDGSVMGSPGGDSGEFILGLHVYENIIGRPMSDKQVEDAFITYLKWMR